MRYLYESVSENRYVICNRWQEERAKNFGLKFKAYLLKDSSATQEMMINKRKHIDSMRGGL